MHQVSYCRRSSSFSKVANGANLLSIAGADDQPLGKILFLTETKGNLDAINDMVAATGATAVIHAGDFGFYDKTSVARLSGRELRACIQYASSMLPAERVSILDQPDGALKSWAKANFSPSQLPLYISGAKKFAVPVHVIYGNQEDIAVVEAFRRGQYCVPNLYLLDELNSHAFWMGGMQIRLFGLGGSIVYHKLFDVGDGSEDVAGSQGAMWATLPQIGQLLETAERLYRPEQARIFVSHVVAGKEPLVNLIAWALKSDFIVSGGLHNRYSVVYNEFSVRHEDEVFRSCANSISELKHLWQSVRQVATEDPQPGSSSGPPLMSERCIALIEKAIALLGSPDLLQEPVLKNTWSIHLPDYRNGHVLLDIHNGRFSMQTSSEGANFAAIKSKFVSHATKPLNSSLPPAAHDLSILLQSWPSGSDEASIKAYFKDAHIRKAGLVSRTDSSGSSVWALDTDTPDKLLNYEGALVAGRQIRFRVRCRDQQ